MLKIEFLGCKRLRFTILAENQQLVLVVSNHTQVILMHLLNVLESGYLKVSLVREVLHGLSRSVKYLAGEFDFYAPEVWRYLERKG